MFDLYDSVNATRSAITKRFRRPTEASDTRRPAFDTDDEEPS